MATMFRNSLRFQNSFMYRLYSQSSTAALNYPRFISLTAMQTNKDVQSHYDVLGLTRSATHTQIRNAFLLLSKQELNHGALNSKERYARLKMAYDVLSDSTSRQEYDQQLGNATTASTLSHQSKISLKRIATELEHGRQTIADDIYQKLNVETHKRVENNMDIAPRISWIFATLVLTWIALFR